MLFVAFFFWFWTKYNCYESMRANKNSLGEMLLIFMEHIKVVQTRLSKRRHGKNC